MPFPVGAPANCTHRAPLRYGTVFPGTNLSGFPKLIWIAGDSTVASVLAGGGGITLTLADGITEVPFGLYPSTDLASGDILLRAKFGLSGETPFLAGYTKRKALRYGTVFPGSNLTDFPKLIKISGDSEIAAELSGGGGITITLADGTTEVPFGLYPTTDLASGDVILRMLMDPLTAATTGDVFGYIYYDSTASTVEDKAGTVSNGYALFMPLEEDPSGGTPQMYDWVSESNVGTSAGSMTSGDLVAGQVGNGLEFDGSDDEISCPVIDSNSNYSVECIVNIATGNRTGAFWKNGNAGSSNGGVGMGIGGGIFETAGRDILLLYENLFWYPAANDFSDGKHHVVVTCDAYGHCRVYVDGVLELTTASASQPATGGSFRIGGYTSAISSNRHFAGLIDEVRIYGSAQFAEWIAYAYQDDFNNADTWTLGAWERAAQIRIMRGGYRYSMSG